MLRRSLLRCCRKQGGLFEELVEGPHFKYFPPRRCRVHVAEIEVKHGFGGLRGTSAARVSFLCPGAFSPTRPLLQGAPSTGDTVAFSTHSKFEMFRPSGFVPMSQAWSVLAAHLAKSRTAIIRARPRSGKTVLGEAAAAGHAAKEIAEHGFTRVVFCMLSEDSVQALLRKELPDLAFEERSVSLLAERFRRDGVIAFFDEAQMGWAAAPGTLCHEIVLHFVKNPQACAVFATTSAHMDDQAFTPDELLNKQFFYQRPAERGTVREWVRERVGSDDVADFLMDVCDGDVGLLQVIGSDLSSPRLPLSEVVRTVSSMLLSPESNVIKSRCLGLYNGPPKDELVNGVLELLCSGAVHNVALAKTARDALRLGFMAVAPCGATADNDTLVALSGETRMTFTHPLQHELMQRRILSNGEWRAKLSDRRRFRTEKPASVLSMITHWLPQVSLVEALGSIRPGKDAPQEAFFQDSFSESMRTLGDATVRAEVLPPEPNSHSKRPSDPTGATKRPLDFVVSLDGKQHGVELLVRAGPLGKRAGLLDAGTVTSLKEHCDRANTSYEQQAALCTGGYVTLLVGNSGRPFTTELDAFKTAIDSDGGKYKTHTVAVAVATRGWSAFKVAAWDPTQRKFFDFRVPRNGVPHRYDPETNTAVPSRHFAPRLELWVQQRAAAGNLTGAAFRVDSPSDIRDIARLKKAIKAEIGPKYPTLIAPDLIIYKPGEKAAVTKQSAALVSNTEEAPYEFELPGV